MTVSLPCSCCKKLWAKVGGVWAAATLGGLVHTGDYRYGNLDGFFGLCEAITSVDQVRRKLVIVEIHCAHETRAQLMAVRT